MKPHPILSTSFLSGYRNNPPLFFTLKSNFSFKSHGILSLSPVITSCSLSLPSAIFSLKPRSVIKFAPRLTRLLCSSVLAHQATATLNPELAALPDDLIQQGPKLVFRTTRREGAKTVFRWATRAASRDRIKGEKSQEIESISASAASRGGGGAHDFSADQTMHHDQLAAYFNRLSISNNGSSVPTSNQRVPNNFMPSSTIVGNGEFSILEQEYYLQRLNQCAFLMAQQYMRHSNLNTAANILNPHSWNRNRNNSNSSSSCQSNYGDQFGYGSNQNWSSSTSQRNGANRGSRFATGAGRQRFRQEERGQGLNLMSTKDQRLGNGSTRQHTPSYYSVPLEELRGQITFVAKDHVGCRFLQKKIDEGKKEEIEMIFNEVMNEDHDHLRELMVDQLGTEFIQKLVEGTNREGRTRMFDLILSDERKLKDMCTDSHGSRAMQKLLERVETREQQSSFTRFLKRITFPLSKTQPGHYVIQVCLKNFSPDCTKGVLEVVLDNCLALAKDRFGCVVVQTSLDYAYYSETKERLLAEITDHARVLSDDEFGNYVVQHVIVLNIPRVTTDLLGQLQGCFVNLSMNKYGSNVVEKVLKEGGEENANMIINEMMNSSEFLNVLQDPYGNYVAQSALQVSKGSVHNALVNIIRSNYPHLHSHLYGKRVLNKARNSRHRV